MDINSKGLIKAELHLLASNDSGFVFHDRKPNVAIVKSVKLGEAESKKLVKLISLLRFAEQMRCHMPRYAVECCYERGSSLRITFCFMCKNIIVSTPEMRGTIQFNPTDTPGNNLLTFLNRAMGEVLRTKNA
jgi:hypothetical protein